jgi:hypothetical protein
MTVTQQYLAGELSLLLAGLQAAAADHGTGDAIAALRREAETTPPASLGSIAQRALRLGDAVCWGLVARGDLTIFDRVAEASAELFEFGVCAGLLADDER